MRFVWNVLHSTLADANEVKLTFLNKMQNIIYWLSGEVIGTYYKYVMEIGADEITHPAVRV